MGIAPQKVLAPGEGESITKWAKREAYRRQKTASDTCSNAAEAKRAITTESAEGKRPVLRPSERRYRALQKWAKRACFWSSPKIMATRW